MFSLFNRSTRTVNKSLRQSSRSPMRMSPRQSPMRQSTRGMSPSRGMSPTRTLNRSVGGMSPTRLNRSVAGQSSQPVMVRTVPENPTPEAKLRFVFKELVLTGDGKVMLEGFRRVLKALNISFTDATIVDLFERADTNGAGSIDYSEFLNFAQHFPLLIEGIFARCKELFDRADRENEMTAARDLQESLQRKEREMNRRWDEAKERLAAQQAQFAAMEDSVKAAKDAARDRNKELVTLQQGLELAKAEMVVKDRDLKDAKEVNHTAQKPLRDMERNLQLGQERLENTEMNLDACRERERELDAMLEEAKRETQQHVDMVTDTNDQIMEMREHVAEFAVILEDSEKDVAQRFAEYRETEEVVRNFRHEMETADAVKVEAAQSAKHLVAMLEDERQGLIPFRKAENEQAAIHAEALREFEEVDRAHNALEIQQAAYDQSRVDAEEAEMQLLENEQRLREQRRNVNMRDDVLFAEGGRFLKEVGRGDTRLGTTNGRTRGI